MQKYYIAVHYRYCYSKTIHIIYPNTHWTVMGMSNTHICVLYSIFLEQSMEIWRSRKPWPQYPKVWLRNSNIMARRRVFLLYQRAAVSQISNRYFLSNCVNVTRLIYLTKSNGLLLKWLHFSTWKAAFQRIHNNNLINGRSYCYWCWKLISKPFKLYCYNHWC